MITAWSRALETIQRLIRPPGGGASGTFWAVDGEGDESGDVGDELI